MQDVWRTRTVSGPPGHVPPAWIIHTQPNLAVCGSMQPESTEDTFHRLWSFSSPDLGGGGWKAELRISFESRIRGFVVIKHWLITGRGALWFQSWAPHCVSNVIFHREELRRWAVQPLLVCLQRWPAPRIIQGRLFIRGIFSKPSPSTQSPAYSQPCTTSWHAAAKLKRGLSKWKTPCCWDTVWEKERELSTLKPLSSRLESILFLSYSPFLSAWRASLKPTTCFWTCRLQYFYSLI